MAGIAAGTISPSKRDAFLQSQKLLRLATVGSDGTPHVVPVWYVYKNGKIYIGTNTQTQKAHNLEGRPRAGFSVDEGSGMYNVTAVTGSGSVTFIMDKMEVERIERLIMDKYHLSGDDADKVLTITDCIIVITPDRFSAWHVPDPLAGQSHPKGIMSKKEAAKLIYG
ncbi:flavin-nucleotide-binding protein [Cenarchaeum symbiosum A]|uniref:Flavin-nucleotide-binding protein n=1 Tax=Cenarchaeum symbiosum (strain A) TaxID=414004 RepID=A0RV74_CENSY|nr:flavin-nucleotide-binding protein [Cenarchaeum symbiosum A]